MQKATTRNHGTGSVRQTILVVCENSFLGHIDRRSAGLEAKTEAHSVCQFCYDDVSLILFEKTALPASLWSVINLNILGNCLSKSSAGWSDIMGYLWRGYVGLKTGKLAEGTASTAPSKVRCRRLLDS